MGNVREIWMGRGGEGSKGKPGKGGNEGGGEADRCYKELGDPSRGALVKVTPHSTQAPESVR